MFERATKKLGLDQAIFMGGNFQNANSEVHQKSMKFEENVFIYY